MLLALGGKRLSEEPELKNRLAKWSKSSDITLAENALRAQAGILGSEVSSAKYAEGVHLLHPSPSSTQFAKDTAEFDVVLIHGVGGDPLGTWRSGSNHQG